MARHMPDTQEAPRKWQLPLGGWTGGGIREMLRGHVVFQGCDCEVGRKGRKNTPGKKGTAHAQVGSWQRTQLGLHAPWVITRSGKRRHGSSTLWAHVRENQCINLRAPSLACASSVTAQQGLSSALCPLTFQTCPCERRQKGKTSPEGRGAEGELSDPLNPRGTLPFLEDGGWSSFMGTHLEAQNEPPS